MKTISFLVISIVCFSLSCKKDEKAPSTDKLVIVGNDAFNNYPNGPLIISDVSISGDYLQIKFGSSGCDGKSWIIELVGSAEILYSDPELGSEQKQTPTMTTLATAQARLR